MMKFCHSCGMPLSGEEGKDYHGNYCTYCTDEKGNLKPREEILAGMTEFLKSWSPNDPHADFQKRAEHFMLSMPAWAKD